jgi:hypothetical protein
MSSTSFDPAVLDPPLAFAAADLDVVERKQQPTHGPTIGKVRTYNNVTNGQCVPAQAPGEPESTELILYTSNSAQHATCGSGAWPH